MEKDEFIRIYQDKITRPGSKELLNWLKSSTFFDDPASANGHCNFRGGLCQHSVNVYHRLSQLVETILPESDRPSDESVAIVSLLHDITKIGRFRIDAKGYGYVVDDRLCMGHGEGSLYRIMRYMKLTEQEAAAVSWHMGMGDHKFKGGDRSVLKLFERNHLALLLHLADTISVSVDEAG